jgi:hypothetical protein
MSKYQLIDRTGAVVAEADTQAAVAEVWVELRDDGAPTDDLAIFRWDEGDPHPTLIE